MKGFVLQFGRNKKIIRFPRLKLQKEQLLLSFKSRGIRALILCLFLLGLAIGAASSGGFDENTLKKLDVLFINNVSARRSMNAFDVFLSCFVSCFLFVFSAFLASFSAWGAFAIPILSVFKGFTVGVSCVVIIMKYQLSGVGFYILVILPGALLFLYTVIRYYSLGVRTSIMYARLSVFGFEDSDKFRMSVRDFVKRSLFAFLMSAVCAAIDMIMWSVFANKFNF